MRKACDGGAGVFIAVLVGPDEGGPPMDTGRRALKEPATQELGYSVPSKEEQ